jgi:hypothetical protein
MICLDNSAAVVHRASLKERSEQRRRRHPLAGWMFAVVLTFWITHDLLKFTISSDTVSHIITGGKAEDRSECRK